MGHNLNHKFQYSFDSTKIQIVLYYYLHELRRLLISFCVCGLLVYFLIIYYDQADIINNIGDHVETELVSDR